MLLLKRACLPAIAVGITSLLAACANDGQLMLGDGALFGATTTASIPAKPRIDPVCATLSFQIESLQQEGVAAKVEKAAAKKHKMTAADLNKAAELNKANAEFQSKCAAT
jgi:hypothetical protein